MADREVSAAFSVLLHHSHTVDALLNQRMKIFNLSSEKHHSEVTGGEYLTSCGLFSTLQVTAELTLTLFPICPGIYRKFMLFHKMNPKDFGNPPDFPICTTIHVMF